MIDYPTASPPNSDVFSEELDTFPIQEKEAMNNSLIQNNNNNINKEFHLQNQENANQPAVRGRKTFAFWVLVALLFTLAIGNLILTITILGVMRLGQGMQSMEIIYKENTSNFYGDIDLDHLYNKDGVFKGFLGEAVEINANDGSILLNLATKHGGSNTKLKIFKNYTHMRGMSSFFVRNSDGEKFFSSSDTSFEQLKSANNFTTKQMETGHIKSGVDDDLNIEGDSINLKGTEGTRFEAREIVWSADQDIYLKTVNGCIILSSKEGVYIDVNKIPVAKLKNNTATKGQYKVCVCMPEGKLFRIPIRNVNDPVYCDEVDVNLPGYPCMKE